jgi:hypothetical protein
MTLMHVWPAGFLPTPDAEGWDGTPIDSRAAFTPETGPPMFRRRTTAETWQFSGRFPAVDQAEQAAFWAFWHEIEEGTLPFLWRDPQDDQPRKWVFAADEPVRTGGVSDTHRDFQMRMIRLPSTPWWAWMIPPDRTVAPRAAYDLKRGLYDVGNGQIGRSAAFSFSRASQGSYVDATGVLQMAAADTPRISHWPASQQLLEGGGTNLLAAPTQMDSSAWARTRTSAVADALRAPDGTQTAEMLREDTSATTTHRLDTPFSSYAAGQAYTLSIYAKAASRRYLRLAFGGVSHGSNLYAQFDLGDGTITTKSVSVTGGAEDCGDGWWRVWITAPAVTTSQDRAYYMLCTGPLAADVTYTGDGVSGLYLWSAALEARSGPPARVISTIAAGARRGLLIEPAATNLVVRSSDFANASWGKTRATVDTASVTAPDGTVTGCRMVEDSSPSNSHRLDFPTISYTAGLTYTFSCWARAIGRNHFRISTPFTAFGGSLFAQWDLISGEMTAASGGVTGGSERWADGWWRCWLTATATVTASDRAALLPAAGPASADATYTGTGINSLHLWGAQAELGAAPTSHIPTVAAAVTRAADIAALIAAHGSCDLRLIYDDGSIQTLPAQALSAGWWPTQARPHIAGIAIYDMGALA